MNIVEGHSNLHTIFVSSSIAIPNVRVVVDYSSDSDLSAVFSQLVENREYINGIDLGNKKTKCSLLTLACEIDNDSPTFPLVTTLIELGANPNKFDNPEFDPWRPYFPNPYNNWGSLTLKPEPNVVKLVSLYTRISSNMFYR